MSAIGRNQPCRCGSRKKTKHCCGVPNGPSETDLARAFLASEAREAARRLICLPEDELDEIFADVLDLPEQHLSLQLPLPTVLTPEYEGLRQAIEDDDPYAFHEHIEAALRRVDSPEQRAGLARNVLELSEAGTIDPDVTDAALLDLDSPDAPAFMRASVFRALSVSVGASCTPAGLLIVPPESAPLPSSTEAGSMSTTV